MANSVSHQLRINKKTYYVAYKRLWSGDEEKAATYPCYVHLVWVQVHVYVSEQLTSSLMIGNHQRGIIGITLVFSGIKGGKVVSGKVIGTWAQEGVGVFVYRPKYRHVCVCGSNTIFTN